MNSNPNENKWAAYYDQKEISETRTSTEQGSHNALMKQKPNLIQLSYKGLLGAGYKVRKDRKK